MQAMSSRFGRHLLLITLGVLVAGCEDASRDRAKHIPTAASEAPEEYRDAEKIVQRRAALSQQVRERLDEPAMFATAREDFEFLEGYQPTAAYDVRTMAYYNPSLDRWTWPAFECRNPACRTGTGKALLFAHEIPGVSVDEDGKPNYPKDANMSIVVCPRCNQKNVHVLELPEVTARRVELEVELAASRAARRQGTANDEANCRRNRSWTKSPRCPKCTWWRKIEHSFPARAACRCWLAQATSSPGESRLKSEFDHLHEFS